MSATTELTYRGLDCGDGCGAPLSKQTRLAGLCPKCQAPRRTKPILRPRRLRNRKTWGDDRT
jgi:hypothetical protein